MKKLLVTLGWVSAIVLIGSMTGCEGITTDDPAQQLLVGPPQNLQVATVDDSTLKFRWKISADINNVQHYEYFLREAGTYTVVQSGTLDPQTTEYVATGLTTGKRYQFFIRSVGLDTAGPYADLEWAPALIFTELLGNPIRVSVQYPGLQFYDSLQKFPVLLPADTISARQWDIAVYFDDTTAWLMQPASYPPFLQDTALGEFFFKDLNAAAFSEVVLQGPETITEVYLSEPLDKGLFNSQPIDLSQFTDNTVFIIRVTRGTNIYYVKLLVKAVNGSLIQGTGDQRYIEVEFSFQPAVRIPYARTDHREGSSVTP